MKKIAILLLLSLEITFGYANMRQLVFEGDMEAEPFTSKYVDITAEKMVIIPNENFETTFKIEYYLKANKSGIKIPLLFYAVKFKKDFALWVDGKKVELQAVPTDRPLEKTDFMDFECVYGKKDTLHDPQGYMDFPITLNDLKYFETDLSEGNHLIKVEYIADTWRDESDWVNKYSVHYALEPAKHWKSFGSLEIIFDATNCKSNITCNLVSPDSGDLHSIAKWHFSQIPQDFITITYQPKTSWFARFLMFLSPEGITLIMSILFIYFHFGRMKKFRILFPEKTYSKPLVLGNIFIPLLFFLTFIFSFGIISSLIGEEAGNIGGYSFLSIFLYPIIMPIYAIVMWLVDKNLKRKLNI